MSNINTRIRDAEARLQRVMNVDYPSIRREINAVRKLSGRDKAARKMLAVVEERIDVSIRNAETRARRVPAISYPEQLPITRRAEEIVQAIQDHPVVIISGETGSGKTTQIPKFCLAAGRGVRGKIGCTQPRRVAAITVARRIAEELGQPLGHSVGYKIRFKETGNRDGYIKIMTDGILLAETQGDRFLNEYDTIIIDEAHERSLNIDFCLGILKTLVARRSDLKLIITSATIDTEKFSAAFDRAPVIEVSGRTYPVDVHYFTGRQDDDEELSHVDLAVQAVSRIYQQTQTGDILVFMPTEQDIRETCEILTGRFDQRAEVLPLFARLSANAQTRVFKPARRRKMIVATNVAETSLTIPGIRFVVDTGLARISRYSPRTRTTSLPVAPISRSSADQRMGRCGRMENGICYRLYTEADFDDRPLYTPPEILRANLAEVILRMTALRLGNTADFPFIDPPAPKSIADGYNLLIELGAITRKPTAGRRPPKDGYLLTPKGRVMAGIPMDPCLSAMLIESKSRGCVKEMAIIASALSIQDPRERPAEKEEAADRAHAAFHDERSDFLTILNLWQGYQTALKARTTGSQMKKYCREQFLSYRRMREWVDIHRQIQAILAEHDIDPAAPSLWRKEQGRDQQQNARYQAIHRSILSGYLSNIALKKEKNVFRAAKGREVMIFPGSALFNRAPAWIMAAEIVETSRLFARTVAEIEPGWIEPQAGDLCRKTYLNPRWERNRGEVVATEQVSVYGLIVVTDRTVSYGPIDPETAADIFIRRALVEGDMRSSLPFISQNRELIDGVQDMEERMRRRDLVIHPEDLHLFYKERLPGVVDVRTLKAFIRGKGGDAFLRLTEADVLRQQPDRDTLALYPDQISIGRQEFVCEYRFEPGAADDGVTVKIPATIAATVPSDAVDWLVPGLLQEKVAALIRGLPKAYRKQLVPVAETTETIVREMPRSDDALPTALSRFIYQRYRVDVPASAWPADELPDHLRMRIALTTPAGEELVTGRDKAILGKGVSHDMTAHVLAREKQRWERQGLTSWDLPDLPESLQLRDKGGVEITVFPALKPAENGVDLCLFQHRTEARASHCQGIRALYAVHFSDDVKHLKKNTILPPHMKSAAAHFGGPRQVEQAVVERVLADLFAVDIRSRKAFLEHADTVKPLVLAKGQAVMKAVIPLLEAAETTRQALVGLTKKRPAPMLAAFLEKMQADLEQLVPATFIRLYDEQRMAHAVRYVKALDIRLRRAMDDFEKDRRKAADVDGFEQRLTELIAGLSASTSADKRSEVESFYWLLQEYKVSVFAQELKTAEPVSPKRLNQKLKQITRMV